MVIVMNTKELLHKLGLTGPNIESLVGSLLIRTALVTALTMPLIRAAHTVQIKALKGSIVGIELVTEKLALMSYKVLSAAITNTFILGMFPSIRNSDHNIKRGCAIFSEFAGGILLSIAYYTFALLAISTPLVLGIIGAVVGSLSKFISDTVKVLSGMNQICHDTKPSQNEDFATKICSNVVDIVKCAAYEALSIMCIPFMAPAYLLSSTFGLENKFNIYDYNKAHSSGIVHTRIKDIAQHRHSDTDVIPEEDGLLFFAALQDHPSMYAKVKCAHNTDGPNSLLTAKIAISIHQYGTEAPEQHGASL